MTEKFYFVAGMLVVIASSIIVRYATDSVVAMSVFSMLATIYMDWTIDRIRDDEREKTVE